MTEQDLFFVTKRRLKKILSFFLKSLKFLVVYFRSPSSPYCQDKRKYANFLKGKRVVLVGPAPGLIGAGQGKVIDSYDRVVRINHALPIPIELKSDLGVRTDVLYHNFWVDSPKAASPEEAVPIFLQSLKWVCCVFPYMDLIHNPKRDIDIFNAEIDNRINFRTVDARRYLNYHLLMRTRLNAGISAIQDLLQFEIKELYITGFSFYQTPKASYEGYRGVRPSDKVHNQKTQMAQVRKWVQKDSRIKIDETIQNILFPKSVKR